jgi:chloride channel protein, CIC family
VTTNSTAPVARITSNPDSPTWRSALLARLGRLRLSENRIFYILAVLIGALTGLAVVAFITVTEDFGHRLALDAAAWRRFLFPVMGSISMGYLLWRFFPEARGSGIPQTKAALFARDGKITLRTVLGKFFCTAGTIASGIPLGREGPSVQIGAGIASVLGRWLGLPPEKVKKLIPVGAAAAIAAAFNTPLAAVLFSLEEVMGDLQSTVIGAVVLASATAWVVLHVFLGNHPLFDKVPQYQIVGPVDYAIYPILGVAGGLVSAAFARLLLVQRSFFIRLPRKFGWSYPLAGGLMVGIMALFVPQVLGVGYNFVSQGISNNLALKFMLILLVLKLFSVTTSFASGSAGGIFGPALFLGAMTGGAVGTIAHHFFPLSTAAPGAYALVGMGAVFAGVIRTPMTSVLMIFEMTQDYAILVPLMIANMVSLFVASRLQHESVYEAIAIQDGIHLPHGPSRTPGQLQVARIMQPPSQLLPHDTTIVQALAQSPSATWIVTGHRGVIGVLSPTRLNQETDPTKTLRDLVDPITFPHVHTDQGLDLALERMGANHLDVLPVVNRADIHKLEGIVTLHEILVAYGVHQP